MPGPEQQPTPEQSEAEHVRHEALKSVVGEYLDADDAIFLDEIDDEEERIEYVYGRLLEQGEDPDKVLEQAGVTEKDDEV